MTTHVTVDNDGHYTVDVFASWVNGEGKEETLIATLKPGEKTEPYQAMMHANREIIVRECQPMRKD